MSRKPRIDDDESLLSMMHHLILQIRPQAEVIGFSSSIHAFEFLMRNYFDLIITDYRMPFLDRLELMARVRLHNPDVPILIMSGEAIARKAVESGANGFLEKTRLPADLEGALQYVGLHTPQWTTRDHLGTDTAVC